MSALPYSINSSDLDNFSNTSIVAVFTIVPPKTLRTSETDALISKDVVNPEEAYINFSTL